MDALEAKKRACLKKIIFTVVAFLFFFGSYYNKLWKGAKAAD